MTFSLLSLCLVVGVCWTVGAYSRLQRLRSQVVQAFGALDVHAVRLLALLGECQAAPGSAQAAAPSRPDGAPAPGAALQAAAVQFGACLAVARAQPLDAPAVAALSAAWAVLQTTWRAWSQPGEGHSPDGLGTVSWQARWADHQAQQAPALRVFNLAVQAYNQAIAQCPACLLAWGLAYRPAGTLPEPPEVLSHES